MIARIHRASEPLRGTVDPPSSKNYTTRYILASCLAHGRSTVWHPAQQDDAEAMVRCVRSLGAKVDAFDREGAPIEFRARSGAAAERLEIEGFGDAPSLADGAAIDPDNAGAVLRLLLGTGSLLAEARFVTAHEDSLGRRPNTDLLAALAQLGVDAHGTGAEGRLPIHLRGGLAAIRAHLARRRRDEAIAATDPIPVSVCGSISSQFVSSILFLAPMLGEDLRIEVTGRMRSQPLIETTVEVLRRAGIAVESSADLRTHRIRAGARYNARRWEVNGDWPGASALLAAAMAVPGSEIRVRRLAHDEQGERLCLDFYRAQGATVDGPPRDGCGDVLLRAPAAPRAAAINGDLCTDAVLAMIGSALFAEGTSRFVSIRNLQFKECDRVREPLEELRRVYATALPAPEGAAAPSPERALRFEPEDDPDTIHITGWPHGFDGGIEVNGRGDHRVIMLLSIVGLRCRNGLSIAGAEHVAKSFPRWFDTLRALGAQVDLIP